MLTAFSRGHISTPPPPQNPSLSLCRSGWSCSLLDLSSHHSMAAPQPFLSYLRKPSTDGPQRAAQIEAWRGNFAEVFQATKIISCHTGRQFVVRSSQFSSMKCCSPGDTPTPTSSSALIYYPLIHLSPPVALPPAAPLAHMFLQFITNYQSSVQPDRLPQKPSSTWTWLPRSRTGHRMS